MAASLLLKLLRRTPPPPLRILPSLTRQPHLPPQNPIPRTDPAPTPPHTYLSNGGAGGRPSPSCHHLQIYPPFPFFFHPASIPLSGVVETDAQLASGDAIVDRTVWADSVKKKRKRKMNKHKYKKLRKRLRRQT